VFHSPLFWIDHMTRQQRWALANPQKMKDAKTRFRSANIDRIRASDRASYAANIENRRAAGRKYAAKHKDKRRAYQQVWQAANKEARRERCRANTLKKDYGITVEQYDAMLAAQNGRCALCRTDKVGDGRWNKRLAVDHDHVTGVVRGLLCSKCNIGLGAFGDNESTLAAAAHYVMRHRVNAA